MGKLRPLLLCAAVLLQACSSCDQVPDVAVTSCQQDAVFLGHVKTDILFVIDDSGSMDPKQVLLRDALASFIDALAASPVQNDYQIAVTTTSVEGFTSSAQLYAGSPSPAGTPYPDGALVEVDPTNLDPAVVTTWGDFLWTSNASAPDPGFYGTSRIMPRGSLTLSDDFKRNVLVGTNGSGREQPFEAMRLALTTQLDATGENAGFLRPGSRLAVIFISDEDDCSGPVDTGTTPIANSTDCREEKSDPASTLTPVAEYVDFLAGHIGGEYRDTVVAVIAGVAPGTLVPSCVIPTYCADNTCNASDKADRFVALLNGLGRARTRLASVCDADFDQALADFATVIMSQTIPLEGAPADFRMLAVRVGFADGTSTGCTLAEAGTTEAASADAVYTAPSDGMPATLTFQNGCTLAPGDEIDINLICAG